MQFKNIVHTAEYQAKDGTQKKKYTNIGTLFVYDDGGMSIKLDSIPVGFDGRLSVYERDGDKQQQAEPRQQTKSPYAAPMPPKIDISTDEIPF